MSQKLEDLKDRFEDLRTELVAAGYWIDVDCYCCGCTKHEVSICNREEYVVIYRE